ADSQRRGRRRRRPPGRARGRAPPPRRECATAASARDPARSPAARPARPPRDPTAWPPGIERHTARVPFAGVAIVPLTPHADGRGTFTELYRGSWETGVPPVQWNAVHSSANVLRGVHVHRRHADYLTVVSGRATVGLHDLRPGSPTNGEGRIVELAAATPSALVIPQGVAHGFYFHE